MNSPTCCSLTTPANAAALSWAKRDHSRPSGLLRLSPSTCPFRPLTSTRHQPSCPGLMDLRLPPSLVLLPRLSLRRVESHLLPTVSLRWLLLLLLLSLLRCLLSNILLIRRTSVPRGLKTWFQPGTRILIRRALFLGPTDQFLIDHPM
jgi:hypothetical protein